MAGPYGRMFVFGDSLSDLGNTNQATGGGAPGAGYSNGRFSNGDIWVNYLATRWGVAETYSLNGGTDYAYGGAETINGISSFIIPGAGRQVANYVGTSPTVNANDLFVVWAGPNNFIDGKPSTADALTDTKNSVNALIGAGAKNILLPNLPDLGLTPKYKGSANEAAANTFSQGFDTGLATLITQLKGANAGVKFFSADVEGLFNRVVGHPGDYGFSNVTDPFMGSGAADSTKYLFFDKVHPTTTGHKYIADLFEKAVTPTPEPASMAALGLGLVTLLRRRKRG